MEWVQKNIVKFGGDPGKVTIFGEASGGSSVHLHMLSSLSKGLFQRAISQSGTALNAWAIDLEKKVPSNSQKLAKMLNCSDTSNQEMVECLRNVDFKMFVAPEKTLSDDLINFRETTALTFQPTLEPNSSASFISDPPEVLIRARKTADVPWIVGHNAEEGALMASIIYNTPGFLEEINNNFSAIGPDMLDYKNNPLKDNITEKIREFYFWGRDINVTTRLNFIDMFTDAKYLYGMHKAVDLHRQYSQQPFYYYLFAHRGSASFSELYGNTNVNYGVCHGDELQYLFPITKTLFFGKELDVFDIRVLKFMITVWSNFAKTGHPTPDYFNGAMIPKWYPVTTEKLEQMYIAGNSHMAKAVLLERAKFWQNVLEGQDF